MKFFFSIAVLGAIISLLLCSGCITPQGFQETTAPPSPVMTTPPAPTSAPVPAATAYPGALPAGQYSTFGSGDRQGRATVYKYEIRPDYTWTAPSFNSPRDQPAASPSNGTVRGYNLETPKEGHTFLFIYVRLINTGTSAVYAPSPSQFVIYANGTLYNFSPVRSSDVVIDKVTGTQYDYQIGRGGEVGYIQPGESNRADGYLIYEVPAAIAPRDTYVLVNLDYQNQAVWRLAEG